MDRDEAYEFLYKLAEGISIMFGRSCETVIHEMNGQHIRNLAIFNGHVTGRKAGTSLSIYGNDTARDTGGGQNLELDYINQQVMVAGRQIKSTTVHMRGEGYHFALGINFDVTVMTQMRGFLDSLTAFEGDLMDRLSSGQPALGELFDSSLEIVNCPVGSMKKAERLALVRLLKEKGAFRMQRSVPYVAERMGVTKFTVYNYLNELA
jgi:predicted transcriptional regulator YheO